MRGIYFYVYIVKCRDGSYYTGVTNDVDRRIEEHNSGLDAKCYTFLRRPVTLKYVEHFYDFMKAERREKQIKGWSRRKKEALMAGDWQKLVELSKNNQG